MSTSPAAIRDGPAASATSRWGTPAPASSQQLIRLPVNRGRPSGTTTRIGRSRWWAVIAIDSAVPNWPPASVPPGPWTSTRSGASSAPRQAFEQGDAGLDERAVIGDGLGDDRVRLGPHRRGDRLAVLRQLADRVVRGHDPVRRVRHGAVRRRGVAHRVGRAAERRPPGVGPGPRTRAAVRAIPIAAAWPAAGPADHDAVADRPGHLGGRRGRVLDDRPRQDPLVDEHDRRPLDAERGPEAGTAVRPPAGSRGRRCRRRRDVLEAGRVEDRAGQLGRRALDRLGRADHRRRGRGDLARELAEEAPPVQIGRDRRVARRRRAPASAPGAGRVPARRRCWRLDRPRSTLERSRLSAARRLST